MKEKEGKYFAIGVVSKLYNIHPQTLRLYEREGLINPKRTEGKTRLYSEKDLERVRIILNLTRNMGVNIAGVEIILNLREKIDEMQIQINDLIHFLSDELGKEFENFDDKFQTALVKSPISKIIKLQAILKKGHDS
ncbi:MAG: MerR family transcriptional regulator [Candidatus Fischerbacteria bacterium RBG_13_37_8]|uniref:MerR family transcriptional regulator n=1 Tax=Candidatus Fischerbacteria bacterium RBG_13_37_8 TaxID=1817863 RepID=A0A1F5V5X7_9BACT|nr:MAG: MerR family transcriptional regulator [Candidatus Fischerbacteria bacterium RBG_13_37_8]